MKLNKKLLYYYLQEHSNPQNGDFKGFTTQELATTLNLQRTNLSALLNELVKENKVVKINGRPVYYRLCNQYDEDNSELNFFNRLIGYKTSLKNAIQLARAAILYPQKPLSTLITGESGVGKGYFASLMYEYAKSQKIIGANAPYIKFNCSYYSNQEAELINHLFGRDEMDMESAVNNARYGVLFINHIECLSALAKHQLVDLIENQSAFKKIIIICATTQGKTVSDDMLNAKFPVTIHVPSLSERKLEERFQLVSRFFTDEAMKMKKEIKINSELLRCFLLYSCEGNLKQLKNDIQIGCANAYVRIFNDSNDMLYVYVYDCPSYVRKGFLFYKEYREEIEALIPQNFSYVFTVDSLKATKDSNHESETMYDVIEKKISELRERGIEEGDVATIVTADIENEIYKYTQDIESTVNKESLSKIVDKDIIELVDHLMKTASVRFNRVYPSSTFSSLCIHISNMIHRTNSNHMLNDKIVEVVKENKEIYSLCAKFVISLEEKYHITIPIDEVILITMFLCHDAEIIKKQKHPVLLIAMHGTVASSIVNVISSLIKADSAYAFDLLLDNDVAESYEQLKLYCKKIDKGEGILMLYDMGSIKKMADSIVAETGLNIKTIELPSTLIALDCVFKLSETNHLNEAYQSIISTTKSNGMLNNSYSRDKTLNKVIVTLCMTGKGTAMQMKQYIKENVSLDENMSVVAMAVSDRKLLMENINHILETCTVQCVIGTYDPKLYGLPFISIASLFDTSPEKLPMLLSLEHKEIGDVDFDKMYEYLDEQLHNINVNKLKRYLRPAVIKIKRLVDDHSIDLEVGLFVHIACSIGRMVNHEPMPMNVKKNQILSSNKRLYYEIKEILAPIEKVMEITFNDDEIAIIIEIIK